MQCHSEAIMKSPWVPQEPQTQVNGLLVYVTLHYHSRSANPKRTAENRRRGTKWKDKAKHCRLKVSRWDQTKQHPAGEGKQQVGKRSLSTWEDLWALVLWQRKQQTGPQRVSIQRPAEGQKWRLWDTGEPSKGRLERSASYGVVMAGASMTLHPFLFVNQLHRPH